MKDIKAFFFFSATVDSTEGAANACGCLVGVWQLYRDVIVTSGSELFWKLQV